MIDWDNRIVQLIDSLGLSNYSWTAWELEFIESLDDRKWDSLSEKQQVVVEKLWDKL